MCGKDGFASTAPDVAKNLASAVAQVIGKSLPGNSKAAVCRKAIQESEFKSGDRCGVQESKNNELCICKVMFI